jgi:hypothetical protein
MAIVKTNYVCRKNGAGRAMQKSVHYYTFRAGEDQRSRQWYAKDGRPLDYKTVEQEIGEHSQTYGYSYRVMISTKDQDARLDASDYQNALGDRFAEYYFIQHDNTEHPHAHAIAFTKKQLSKGDLEQFRDRVSTREVELMRHHDREQQQQQDLEKIDELQQQQREPAANQELGPAVQRYPDHLPEETIKIDHPANLEEMEQHGRFEGLGATLQYPDRHIPIETDRVYADEAGETSQKYPREDSGGVQPVSADGGGRFDTEWLHELKQLGAGTLRTGAQGVGSELTNAARFEAGKRGDRDVADYDDFDHLVQVEENLRRQHQQWQEQEAGAADQARQETEAREQEHQESLDQDYGMTHGRYDLMDEPTARHQETESTPIEVEEEPELERGQEQDYEIDW